MFSNSNYHSAFLLIDFWEQPYLWNTYFGFGTVIVSYLVALIFAVCLFFFLRFLFKKQQTYSFSVTLSLTIIVTSSLGVLAFLIWIFVQIPTYINWKNYGLPLILHPLIPLCFFLIPIIGFLSWYRYLKKHKVLSTNVTINYE